MRLYENVKLCEDLREAKERAAIIFVGDRRENGKIIKDKIADYGYVQIVDNIRSLLREYDTAYKDIVDFYADSKGMEEIKEFCAKIPKAKGEAILQTITELK
jgi:hypothetical protein